MYPFPDYYAQFGIILKTTPSTSAIALHYNRTHEILFIIIFLLILSMEIFSSFTEILHDCIKEKQISSTTNLIRNGYEQLSSTSSSTLSQTEQTISENLSSTLDTPASRTEADF